MRGAVPLLSTDLTTHAVPHSIQALKMGRCTAPKALSDPARGCGDERGKPRLSHVRARTAAPGKTERIVTTAAHIAAMAAATPQERAAAAVPALRRGADNEQWCCCRGDVSDNERASGNGSIAVAGTQVASAPRDSRAVFLFHTSRCSVEFSSAHGGGRGREVCSPASWRCVPRHVSASAKARRPAALSTPAAWGATGQLSGIWLGLGVSASGVPRKATLSSFYFLDYLNPLYLKKDPVFRCLSTKSSIGTKVTTTQPYKSES
jgi:hypothetical protein